MATELGVQSSSEKMQRVLAKLARSDTWHDFSKINLKKTINLIENSALIDEKLQSTQYDKDDEDENMSGGGEKKVDVRFLEKLSQGKSNVYQFFENTDFLVHRKDDIFMDEDNVLEKILGDIYRNIRNSLEENEDAYGLLKEPSTYTNVIKPMLHPENEKEENKIHINIENGEILRTYKYSCYPTKLRGKFFNLPFAFEKLTNARTFVLLIDASYVSFAKIRNVDALLTLMGDKYDPNIKYTFYILKNNENISDSAVKIDLFEEGNKNVKIKFLEERDNTRILYPSYNEDLKSQNRNLYSRVSIINQKTENSVNGLIEFKENIIRSFPFLSKISKKGVASILALQKVNELKKIDDNSLIYMLLKRAGDWCQALSLLDKTRMYNVYDYDTNEFERTTNLFELQNEAEIALVTHDRILLAYSILLGLNVFYTFKFESKGASDNKNEDGRSIVWATYFKNTLDISSLVKVDVLNKIDEKKINTIISDTSIIYQTIIDELNNLKLKELAENIYYDYVSDMLYKKIGDEYEEYKPTVGNEDYLDFLIGFVQHVRKWLSMLANIVPAEEINNMKTELMKLHTLLKKGYTSATNKNEYIKLNASNFLYLSDLKDKIDEMMYINSSLNNIYSYSNAEKDELLIKEYFSSKGMNKESIVSVFNTIKNDFEKAKHLIKIKDDIPEVDFINIIPFISELKYNNITLKEDRYTKNILCKFLILLRNNVLPEGYPPDLTECSIIDDRKKRATVYTPSGLNFLKKKKQKGGFSELERVYNELMELKSDYLKTSYVNDENGRFYSIVDKYYVSINEFYILEKGLKLLKNDTLSNLVFARFLIYYIDEIYSNILALSNYDDNTFQDDLYLEHLRMYAELYSLEKYMKDKETIVSIYFDLRKKWTVNYLEEFSTSLRGSFEYMIESKLLPFHNRLKEKIVDAYLNEVHLNEVRSSSFIRKKNNSRKRVRNNNNRNTKRFK
jgi:hypothetical protein